MKPIGFARQYGINFTARYVRAGEYGRRHYMAALQNKATGKMIEIAYAPSPLHNPASHMQERKQALKAGLAWISHCAESLFWHERDIASANRYSVCISSSRPATRVYTARGSITRTRGPILSILL